MWLIRAALRRPISVLVIVVALAFSSILALLRTRVDIFPDLDLPVIYVAQPYGGMSPQQMEGFIAYYYEYHFLYINGIENVEAKSIQGTALLRLTFHSGTDMSQALAQTISYVNRARAFMPPGTVSPFVIRYDAGTLPVGYLVFSSESRTLGEIQDQALNRVRPVFATLPGVSSPPPFGGNQRTIVVSVDPSKLRGYKLSPQSVVQALVTGNSIEPAGDANIGNFQTLVTTDSTVGQISDLLDIPLRMGSGASVYLRDVGTVSDSSDILAGYALLNGKRTVYIPVTKRPDASTITVVNEVRASLPRFQSLIPEDIKITYEFDQSQYVRDALLSVLRGGLLGAILTGLTLLFFLRDWRSSLIVIITIPFALLMAVVALWAMGQTINIMTLGGLALAVGVLVDEGTVLLENIHVHLALGEPKARAVLEASREVAIPRLLAMLSVLAVFLPSFFMVGPARSLFVPLSLAVGFSMGASYLLSSSLVPVLSNWLLKAEKVLADSSAEARFDRFRKRFYKWLDRLMSYPAMLLGIYSVGAIAVLLLVVPRLSREIFPSAAANQFRLRFDAPDGTRVPVTEEMARRVLDVINREAGGGNIALTLSYVGTQGSSYPINAVFLWTSGPHEAVMNIALRPGASISLRDLEEKLRNTLPQQFPGSHFSFDPGDLVSQTLISAHLR
jgi:multidrug efflux pump subunit AcrB